jgi:nucleoside-triphosphatase THEP1
VSRYGIVAAPRRGKTSALLDLAHRLTEVGVTCTGVAQPARCEGGQVVGYELQDIPGGERRPFATRRRSFFPPPRYARGEAPVREEMAFRFDAAGFAWAATRIHRPADVLLVDELGWLEAGGDGHLPAVETALRHALHRAAVFTIRQDALPACESSVGPLDVFGALPSSVPALFKTLLTDLSKEECT